ncbi:MAG TPA: hypothetical protein VMV86_03490, partial [Methanosarcinales archaeon]|nr:hypothetical protein [Methanosarcinales archaeon]
MNQIIGYHAAIINNKPVIVNNKGEAGNIDWLIDDCTGKDYKKVAYDLDYFASILFRAINIFKDEAEILLARGKLHIYLDNTAYDITYFPSKYLSIARGAGYGRPFTSIFNAEQYLPATHYELEPTLESCISKAQEAQTIASEASWAFYLLGLDPDTITSPVRSMEKSLLANIDLPTHLDIPPEVNDLALNCCPGNWVEAYKLGYFPKTYDLDITSCYASMLAELYDTRRGSWIHSTVPPVQAIYGFAHGTVTIASNFSPIIYRKAERLNYTPVGIWDTCLTLQEIKFIKKYELGSFYIEDGWWWIPQGVQYQPLKGIVNNLHNKREEANPLQNKILKRCLAGLWGRTLHTHQEQGKLVYGDAFNPV